MIQNSELIEWLKKKAETVTMPEARKMYQAAIKALEAQKYMIRRQDVRSCRRSEVHTPHCTSRSSFQ